LNLVDAEYSPYIFNPVAFFSVNSAKNFPEGTYVIELVDRSLPDGDPEKVAFTPAFSLSGGIYIPASRETDQAVTAGSASTFSSVPQATKTTPSSVQNYVCAC
jgi:hypothetical protein